MKVRDIMRRALVTILPDASMQAAVEIMRAREVRHILYRVRSRTGYHPGDGALSSAERFAPRPGIAHRPPGHPHSARHRVGDAGRMERGSPALFSMARQLEIVLLRHARGDVVDDLPRVEPMAHSGQRASWLSPFPSS